MKGPVFILRELPDVLRRLATTQVGKRFDEVRGAESQTSTGVMRSSVALGSSSRMESAVSRSTIRLRRKRKPWSLCYYPGCNRIAAARHGMFCVEKHKGLPQLQKEKYRALHRASEAVRPVAAAKVVRRRRKRTR